MPITVSNRTRTIFVLNLRKGVDYGTPELAASKVSLTMMVELDDGHKGKKIVEKELPNSITWLPQETKEDLPSEIQEIEEFRAAIQAGRLRITHSR